MGSGGGEAKVFQLTAEKHIGIIRAGLHAVEIVTEEAEKIGVTLFINGSGNLGIQEF